MWAALRSDLKEFVSTVSTEGNNTLYVLDEKLTSIDKDIDSEEEEEEEESDIPSAAVLDGEVFGEGYDSTGIISNASDEVAHRRSLEETYTEELPNTESVQIFLETLQLADEEITAEIAHILQSYPDTVNQYFTDLVPTEVSYEDFWSRYLYRCNEERVVEQWEKERADRARARKAAAEALINNAKQGWNMARHLVGDAAKALIGDTSSSRAAVDDNDNNNSSAKAIANGLNWGGRPPFVLQSNEESEEEDDEEELGWDDDEEEEIDDEEDFDEEEGEEEITQNSTVGSEEIIFQRDEAKFLHTATQEEMDQLHQTIEMQRVEIESLKIILESNSNKEITFVDGANSSDVEHLQLIIFEKDSEIAGLKSKLQDTHEDDHDEEGYDDSQMVTKKKYLDLKNEVQNLEDAVATKNVEIAQVKEEMTKTLDSSTEKSSIEIFRLKSEIERLTQNAAAMASGEEDSLMKQCAEDEARISKLSQDLDSANSSREEAQSAAIMASGREDSLMKQCAEYEARLCKLNQDLDSANNSREEAYETVLSQNGLIEDAQTSIRQLQDTLAFSQSENKALQEEISVMGNRINELVDDLKCAQDMNKKQAELFSSRLQEEFEKGTGLSPESSLSSAVNVDSNSMGSPPSSLGCQPLPHVSTAKAILSEKPSTDGGASGEGQDEDDWGDAWGDEVDVEDD